jgi:hypothetical protein
VTAAGLALTGALALACFTKLHGVLFLGTSRDVTAVDPGEERGLVAPQMVLAGACLAIGLLPFLVIPTAVRVAAGVLHGAGTTHDVAAVSAAAGEISLAALALLVLGAAVWGLRAAVGSRAMVRAGVTWGCGYPVATSRMQHTASSYASSLLAVFGPLSGSSQVSGPMTLEVHVADPVLDRIAQPAWGRFRETALRLRRIQTGRIFWYLVYVIAALLGLLLYLWLAAR